MAAVEYRIAVLIAVALKFVVILFCDLSESEFNKVEIQNGGKIAVQILERLDFLCFSIKSFFLLPVLYAPGSTGQGCDPNHGHS